MSKNLLTLAQCSNYKRLLSPNLWRQAFLILHSMLVAWDSSLSARHKVPELTWLKLSYYSQWVTSMIDLVCNVTNSSCLWQSFNLVNNIFYMVCFVCILYNKEHCYTNPEKIYWQTNFSWMIYLLILGESLKYLDYINNNVRNIVTIKICYLSW